VGTYAAFPGSRGRIFEEASAVVGSSSRAASLTTGPLEPLAHALALSTLGLGASAVVAAQIALVQS